jgi:hypothetical protein
MPNNRFYLQLILTTLLGLCLAACAAASQLPLPPAPTASPPPPAVVSEVNADTLATLVLVEREASIQGNLPLLEALWAEDSRIVDGRGSADEDDDYMWNGRAAILDRYRLAVFPAPPPPLTAAELTNPTPSIDDDSATLINGGDRWRFVQDDGRWWLQELVYSSPSPE